jgi:hypothetical protein
VNIQKFLASGWEEGREIQTDTYDVNSSNGTHLLALNDSWQQGGHVSWSTSNNGYTLAWQEPARNPQMIESDTTLSDTSQVSKQTFAYDQYDNKTDVAEYDYGATSPARHTSTTYLTAGYDLPPVHLRSLPCTSTVYQGLIDGCFFPGSLIH